MKTLQQRIFKTEFSYDNTKPSCFKLLLNSLLQFARPSGLAVMTGDLHYAHVLRGEFKSPKK